MPSHRFVTYIAPALFLGLLFFSCTKKEDANSPVTDPASAVSPDIRVVATVNGDPITLAEFQERLARAGFRPDKEVEPQVKEELLNRLVERKMLLREAQRRRIKIGLPDINNRIESFRSEQGQDVKTVLAGQGIDFEKWKNDVWEDLMIERLLAHDVNNKVAVSGVEVRKYYQNNPQQFERSEQVRVRQIVVSSEAEAQQVLEQLQGNPDFAAIARERSTAPEAAQGGDLGYFSRGDMPAEFNVVFTLPKGGVSGIVKSPYGFHVFKLESKRPAGLLGFEEASPTIREKLMHEKQDRRYQQWFKELRSRTKFEVNYQALGQELAPDSALSGK
jgi:parvulin-like peptidyl-prolyl isomerase